MAMWRIRSCRDSTATSAWLWPQPGFRCRQCWDVREEGSAHKTFERKFVGAKPKSKAAKPKAKGSARGRLAMASLASGPFWVHVVFWYHLFFCEADAMMMISDGLDIYGDRFGWLTFYG